LSTNAAVRKRNGRPSNRLTGRSSRWHAAASNVEAQLAGQIDKAELGWFGRNKREVEVRELTGGGGGGGGGGTLGSLNQTPISILVSFLWLLLFYK
jgi:hypothetical protein